MPDGARTTDLPDDPDAQTEPVTNQTPQYPGAFAGSTPRPGLWSRLKPMQRVGVLAAAFVLPCCGGLAVIGAFADDEPGSAPLPAPAADQRFAEVTPTAEASTAPARATGTTPPATAEAAAA